MQALFHQHITQIPKGLYQHGIAEKFKSNADIDSLIQQIG